MNLLDPTIIRDLVDYSFGDQSSDVHKLWDSHIKPANMENYEFLKKYEEIKKNKSFMTLFIDNIRLYRRKNIKYTKIELINSFSKDYKDKRVLEFKNEDLLELCGKLSDINFIIYTGFEDTPIDDDIFSKIPDNVLKIYASNSISFGEKVYPIPYGIQRKLNPYDKRHEFLFKMISSNLEPSNLLYINHNTSSNPERQKINEFFKNFSWVTIHSPNSINEQEYLRYLTEIKNHKFMICPDGNAIGCECHRDWEVIYMRRVPIVEDSEYLRQVFNGIPVLFVKSFLDVTEKLLTDNDYLFDEMQKFNLKKLDFKEFYYKSIEI
jgi:hypothetical protein